MGRRRRRWRPGGGGFEMLDSRERLMWSLCPHRNRPVDLDPRGLPCVMRGRSGCGAVRRDWVEGAVCGDQPGLTRDSYLSGN